MSRFTRLFPLLLLPFVLRAQTRDYSNWINFGSSHTSKWLQIAPAKLGPNALPVPEIDWAQIDGESRVETGAHYHQLSGDTAINSFFSFYWNIAPGRAAIRIWGQPSETFRLSNAMRDERQIYYDDTGWITQTGDLLISTYVQLLREKNGLPSLSLSYTLKTTTGSNHHGRYTDASLDYFYLAAGKSFLFHHAPIDEIRIAGLLGFYVWQTNKVEMAQDEGPVFVGGVKIRKGRFTLQSDIGGYTGYDAYEFLDRWSGEDRIEGYNDPLVLRTRLEMTGGKFIFLLEYQSGFRDYPWKTFRVGLSYRFRIKRVDLQIP